MKTIVALTIIALLAYPVPAEKKRAWQVGVIYDVQSEDAGAYIAPVYGVWITGRRTETYYYLTGTKTIYTLYSPKGQLNVTIKGYIKFAVEKDNCYLIDDDGKERKLKVVRKEAK